MIYLLWCFLDFPGSVKLCLVIKIKIENDYSLLNFSILGTLKWAAIRIEKSDRKGE